MIRLTPTGKVLLALAALLYAASLTSQSSFLLLLIGILLACFALNFTGARQAVRQVAVTPPRQLAVPEGGRLTQSWRVRNEGCTGTGLLSLSAGTQPLLQVSALERGGELHLVPALTFPRRGVYPLAEAQLASVHPFGLLRAQRRLPLPGEVVVYPDVYPAPCPAAAGFDAVVGGKFHGQRRSAAGTHFSGLRPFQPGDPVKQVHWASSAKGRGLMVKTFAEELSGRVAVFTDAGTPAAPESLDDALRAAGSLMFAALDAGHHVEWIELASLARHLFPPFADGQELLEQLARVRPEPGGLAADRLRAAVLLASRRSALCFVLTALNEDVLEGVDELRAAGRVVSVYAPAGVDWPVPPGWLAGLYGPREITPAA